MIQVENQPPSGRDPLHILLIEDDDDLRQELAEYLIHEGFDVEAYADATILHRRTGRFPYDAILLDVMLPGDDGISLTRELRARSDVPIVIITGRGDIIDRVVGLEIGADHYVSKPFDFRELRARIRAVTRRRCTPQVPIETGQWRHWEFGDWRLDTLTRHLIAPSGELVELTSGEYALLEVAPNFQTTAKP